ncbi:MAG: oligosaccharide flippase family protein [Pyrinomonadaceae bacterium]|nr:oligosaccharide flippase family protein [Pyrinomonadaceae bacterium]
MKRILVANLNKFYNFFSGKRDFSLKINTFSNFFGNAWSALISIIFVPINLYYLGVEAYGIIGIFNSLQSFVWLLDLGLSGIIARELPQLAALPHKAREILELTRTASIINFVGGILISIFLVGISPIIARYWLTGTEYSIDTISQALMIMSSGFIVQWALNFYNQGLAGLQKQAVLNIISVIFTSIRSVGGVLVLALISPTIQAFLIWQILIGSIQLLMTVVLFKSSMPAAYSNSHFNWRTLHARFKFAAGLTVMSVLGLILHQLDKIILSRFLSLELFGYYSLATTITSLGLGMIPRSITNAVYPRFSYFVGSNDESGLRTLFHRSTQAMSVLMLPAAALMIVFPRDILYLWTQNQEIANNTWVLLMILTLATVLNGFLTIPFYVQLAYGWTRIVIITAIIALFTITPMMVFTVKQYGAIAGALNWLALNLIQILISVTVMHRYTLVGEQWKWYFTDILKPFSIALFVTYFCGFVYAPNGSNIEVIVLLALTSTLTYLCTAMAMNFTRNWIIQLYKNYFHRNLAS